jgi:hypothetical protein
MRLIRRQIDIFYAKIISVEVHMAHSIRHGRLIIIALKQLGTRRATLLDIAAQADVGIWLVKETLPGLLAGGAVLRDGPGKRGAFRYSVNLERAIEMDLYA